MSAASDHRNSTPPLLSDILQADALPYFYSFLSGSCGTGLTVSFRAHVNTVSSSSSYAAVLKNVKWPTLSVLVACMMHIQNFQQLRFLWESFTTYTLRIGGRFHNFLIVCVCCYHLMVNKERCTIILYINCRGLYCICSIYAMKYIKKIISCTRMLIIELHKFNGSSCQLW